MTWISAVFLGIIEGLTEFFPISSTGHLIIAEKLLKIPHPSLFFNVVIQLGAILAVLVFYRERITELFRECMQGKQTWVPFAVATLPVLLVGAIFHSTIARMQENISIVAVTTFTVALLFVWGQKTYARTLIKGKNKTSLTLRDYITIGIWQAVSVIPGVSRSGITILGGITRKTGFSDAVEIAFLLSIPAMIAAAGFEGLQFLRANGHTLDVVLLTNTAIGFVSAFFTAFATISITLPILRKYGFTPFVVYRILLSLALFFLFPLAL